MSYIVEKDWISSGLRCIAIAADSGHRCGYVGLPKSHPLYGVGYGAYHPALDALWGATKEGPIGDRGIIPILCAMFREADEVQPTPELVFDVHGSITYANGGDDYPIESDLWWYGFDCAHADDANDLTLITDEHLRAIYAEFGNDGVVRDLAFVVAECEKLAAQLASMEA